MPLRMTFCVAALLSSLVLMPGSATAEDTATAWNPTGGSLLMLEDPVICTASCDGAKDVECRGDSCHAQDNVGCTSATSTTSTKNYCNKTQKFERAQEARATGPIVRHPVTGKKVREIPMDELPPADRDSFERALDELESELWTQGLISAPLSHEPVVFEPLIFSTCTVKCSDGSKLSCDADPGSYCMSTKKSCSTVNPDGSKKTQVCGFSADF